MSGRDAGRLWGTHTHTRARTHLHMVEELGLEREPHRNRWQEETNGGSNATTAYHVGLTGGFVCSLGRGEKIVESLRPLRGGGGVGA